MARSESGAAGGLAKAGTARELAFDVLSRWSLTSAFVDQLFEERSAASSVSPPDRRLAAELAFGTIRRRATLAALISQHLRRPLEELEPGLRLLLELGAYQLVCLTAVPVHAAVNETTELARRVGQPRWTGFLNAVLRSLSRVVTDEMVAEPGPAAVPLTEGRYRRLTQEVFPRPDRDPARYFATAFSFPAWLAERWAPRFSADDLFQLGFWFNTPAALCLRVNALRGSRDTYLEMLSAEQVPAHAGREPQAVWLDVPRRVEDLPGYAEGWFVVQDESAMAAGRLLAPQPGQRVLDLCAAPGGKTSHLAELMQDQGVLFATDVANDRLALVRQTCQRLGLRCVATQRIRRDAGDVPAGPFDAILLDVPCSNTGVLGKRIEARWRVQPEDVTELVEIQTRLLRVALSRAAATARVVYSTCSIEPEENRGVVEAVLREHPEWRLAEEQSHQPGQPVDGGYQALLVRGG